LGPYKSSFFFIFLHFHFSSFSDFPLEMIISIRFWDPINLHFSSFFNEGWAPVNLHFSSFFNEDLVFLGTHFEPFLGTLLDPFWAPFWAPFCLTLGADSGLELELKPTSSPRGAISWHLDPTLSPRVWMTVALSTPKHPLGAHGGVGIGGGGAILQARYSDYTPPWGHMW